MTVCNKCGDCCVVIVLCYTKSQIKHLSGPDEKWIRKYFRRISKAEAYKRMPTLMNVDAYFYTCTAFDPKKRLCTKQNEKSRICNGFPWYGRPPNKESLINYFPRCSFLKDLKNA